MECQEINRVISCASSPYYRDISGERKGRLDAKPTYLGMSLIMPKLLCMGGLPKVV